MALRSMAQLGQGDTLEPETERERLAYIARNRLLFEGNFRELGIIPTREEQNPLRINWFRRVATFYPELMFAERPTVLIEENEQAQAAINPYLPSSTQPSVYDWWTMLEFANTDMLRFGMAVLASDPDNPVNFVRFEPDRWFEVIDERGEHVGDIAVRMRARQLSNDEGFIDVYRYPVDQEATWTIYKLDDPTTIGPLLEEVVIPSRKGRQVRTLQTTIDRTSIFEGMKYSVASMSKDVGRLDRTLERNSNPHLYGPDGMLEKDKETGQYKIDPQGMFLPMAEEDSSPGYVQWDANIEALEWDFNNHERTALVQAGLSPLLFDPAQETNALSGVSLRRTLMPTWGRLNRLKTANEALLRQLVLLWNFNRQFVGLEVFDLRAEQISVEWPFMQLFEDITRETNDDGGATN